MPVAFAGFLEPRYHQASGQNLQVSGGQLQVATSCDQWNWPVKIVNVIPIPWWLKVMLEDIGCVAIKHGSDMNGMKQCLHLLLDDIMFCPFWLTLHQLKSLSRGLCCRVLPIFDTQ